MRELRAVVSVRSEPGGTRDSRERGCRGRKRFGALIAVTTIVLSAAACGHNDSRTYDIAPIFPLSAGKCAKYGGKAEGSGLSSHCWVTKSECEQAASDWRQAMQNLPDAIEFSC